jgi:hypothetical protein
VFENFLKGKVMITSESALSPHWAYYSECASETDTGPVNDLGNGREEQLWAILEAIELRLPLTEECRQRLDRIPWNRAKKFRRLGHFLEQTSSLCVGDSTDVIELADTLEHVRTFMSAAEWDVECDLASGRTYAEVALKLGISPEALKVRAGRWRAHVRRDLPTLCKDWVS